MIYDLIIIGAGPAGISASIYASRYKINHLVIGEIPGGLITEAHNVCNFPGEESISGFELMEKMKKHAQNLGAEIISMEKIVSIKKQESFFELSTESKKEFQAKTILLATGTKHRKLGLAEESKYLGKGLAYCATCDAMFFKDKKVAVVGAGNSAMTASLYLSEVAKEVYLLARGEELKGETIWIDQVKNNKKINVFYKTQVEKIEGESKVEAIIINKENKKEKLDLDGVFIEIGTDPDNFLSDQLNIKNDRGFITVDEKQATNIEGVWAAGDITTSSSFFRQVITACSEGAIAAYAIFSFLQKNK